MHMSAALPENIVQKVQSNRMGFVSQAICKMFSHTNVRNSNVSCIIPVNIYAVARTLHRLLDKFLAMLAHTFQRLGVNRWNSVRTVRQASTVLEVAQTLVIVDREGIVPQTVYHRNFGTFRIIVIAW